MKKQKAFTLIELLAVIVILAVIALIASPIIMGVIGKTKRQAFERSIDGILDAVKIDYSSDGFVSPREYFYEGNNLILLTVNEETLDESVGIKGKINGKGFIYVDEDGNIHIENVCSKDYCANGTEPNVEITENVTGEIPELSKNDPMIKIKGEKTVYVNIGDTYTELGATAKTKSGQVLEYTTEITLNGTIVTSIDTTNENTYVITYKTEHEGKTVTDTRNVVILDMKPVINITEGKESYVKEQEILITVSAVRPNMITSFTLEMKKDGESIKTETVTGISKTITLNETGNYEVIVTVTDNNGHTNTISRAYKIDSEPPTIEFTSEITLKANEVSGFVFSEDDTVVVSDNSNLVTWETEGNLNSTIVEDQEITYIATDEAGNETRKTRLFHIDEADGPSVNFSSPGSNGNWIKAITVTLYAEIRVENDELTAFTYQVDDGEIVNVPITNNQQMDVDVTLNTTGRHTIKVTATGKHGNTTESPILEFLIDEVTPTLTVTDYKGKYGADIAISTLYKATFGRMEGNVVCKDGTTRVNNIKDITLADDHTIKCTATPNNGKASVEKTISLRFESKTFTEIMNGSSQVAAKDPDKNPRYVGSNPNNYVKFNNENWRVIGIIDGYVKIISEKSMNLSWDNSGIGHGDYGWNDWSQAAVMKYLRDTYYPSINTVNQNYIDKNHRWKIGGISDWTTKTRIDFYNAERGTTVYTGRPTYWDGNVGLMYVSDYAYATSGGDNCGTTTLWQWQTVKEECINTNWLYTGGTQWTLNPQTHNENAVTQIRGEGHIDTSWSTNSRTMRPVVYLKPNVKVKGGTGTSTDPYIIGIDFYDQDCTKKTETIMGKQVTGCMMKNDPDNNLRYVGANPSNYVKFNNELWRIIGVFGNNVKIVKSTSVGKRIWHSNRAVTNWEVTDIEAYLNDTYYPQIEGSSKSYINSYTWKLGGCPGSGITRESAYHCERGTTVASGNKPTWPGYVGLIYPSDYAYASSEEGVCDTSNLSVWNNTLSTTKNCVINSWLYSGDSEWTITTHSQSSYGTFGIFYVGSVFTSYTNDVYIIRPTVYLNTNVKIKSGTGTAEDPYILGL